MVMIQGESLGQRAGTLRPLDDPLILPDPQSDEALLARLRAGDESAFRALVDRHRPWLVRFCTRLLAYDSHAAEDAAQESLLKLHAAARRDARPMRVRAWLTVVARNTCFDEHRRRRPDLPGELPERPAPGDDPFSLDAALSDAWPRLSGRHREVLYLREVLGFSYKEIGSIMGLNMPAVETLVFRARAALRREYERAGGKAVGGGPGGGGAPPAAVLPGIGAFGDAPAGAAAGPGTAAMTAQSASEGAATTVPAEASTAGSPPAVQPATLRSLLGNAVPAGWTPQRSRTEANPTTSTAPPSPPIETKDRWTPLRDAAAAYRPSDRPTIRKDDADPGPLRSLLPPRPETPDRPERPVHPLRSLLESFPTLLDPLPIGDPEPVPAEPVPAPAPDPDPEPEPGSQPIRETVRETKETVFPLRDTPRPGDGNVADRDATVLQRQDG